MKKEGYTRGHIYPGVHISFEGGEGGGKETQSKKFVEELKKRGYFVTHGREPGSTEIGEQFRAILQDPNRPVIGDVAEMFGYLTARAEYVRLLVKPTLEIGGIHTSDRFEDSTTAYQGYGNGTDLNVVRTANSYAVQGTRPDITYFLKVDPKTGLSKVTGSEFAGHKLDKIEGRDPAFHQRVYAGFLRIAQDEPERVKIIPYVAGDPDLMHEQIMKHFDNFMNIFGLVDKLKKTN